MGRRRSKRSRRVRSADPLPDRSNLPPDVAEFMRSFDVRGFRFDAVPVGDGTWRLVDAAGNPLLGFGFGSEAASRMAPEGGCMDLAGLWADPEYRRQRVSGLVDVYGRPLHPEARDFFSEYHSESDHGHRPD